MRHSVEYRPLSGEIFDLVDGHSEQEEVIGSHLLAHLNIGTIQRADRQRAVQLRMRKRDKSVLLKLGTKVSRPSANTLCGCLSTTALR